MIKRSDILASLPAVMPVETQIWGICYVRQLKGKEFARFMAVMDETAGGDRLAKLTVLGLCDAQGKRLLEDGDEAVLLDAPFEPQGEIAAAFLELNGMQQDEKKSSETQNISPISSPSNLDFPTPPELLRRSRSES